MHKLLLTAAATAIGFALAAAPAAAQTLEKIKQRGVIVVGSKTDYKPFGFRDPSGKIVGMEPDMAARRQEARRQAGARAGRLVEPHAVPAAGQDRPDDRHHERHAGAPQGRRHHRPPLLRLRRGVLANKKAAIKSWDTEGQEGLRHAGRVLQQAIAEKYGADLMAFKGQTEAEERCRTATASAGSMTTRPSPSASRSEVGGLRDALPTIMEEPWGLAVKIEEREGAWGKFMAETVDDWHDRQADRAREEVGHQASAFLKTDAREGSKKES